MSEQRQQPDIGHELLDVGYGVFYLWQGIILLDDAETVNPQVERELEADVVNADFHTSLLGSDSSRLLYRPVLNRGQVEQCGEYEKQ